MKMFRRLYWVAEQINGKGGSKVTGVYTSIQDLIHKGLHWCDENGKGNRLRLTLVKPDSFNSPFGIWESPDFNGLMESLQTFVDTHEYTMEECVDLRNELEHFIKGEQAKAS